MSNNIEIPKDVVVTNEEMNSEFANRDLRSYSAQPVSFSPVKRFDKIAFVQRR